MDRLHLFALTVVFKPVDGNNSQARWESDYKTGVVRKFQKNLERNKDLQHKAIPYEELFYFEYEQTSHKKSGSKQPFHIHALLPIKKSQTYRVWSPEMNDLLPRLKKDILSISTVQSILVEKICTGRVIDWAVYMTKMKSV
jgi:hypothetical protein